MTDFDEAVARGLVSEEEIAEHRRFNEAMAGLSAEEQHALLRPPTEDERLAFERRYRSGEAKRDDWGMWCPSCDTPLIRGVAATEGATVILCKECYEQLKVKEEA
jgi:hypothetical protein